MNYLPLSLEWLAGAREALTRSQRAMVVDLLAHVMLRQQWLPVEREQCWVIAGVRTRQDERDFDLVMRECFDITEGGRRPRAGLLKLLGSVRFSSVHNNSVTRSLRGGYAEELNTEELPRVTRAEQNKDRQKHHRALRSALVTQALRNGFSPMKKTSIEELRQMAGALRERNDGVTTALLRDDSRARARPEFPINTNTEDKEAGATRARVTPASVTPTPPTPYGRAALAMKQAGMPVVNPSHPGFRALVDAGAEQELIDVVAECVAANKGFAYALAVVRGRREDEARKAAVAATRDPLAEWAGPTLAPYLKAGLQ